MDGQCSQGVSTFRFWMSVSQRFMYCRYGPPSVLPLGGDGTLNRWGLVDEFWRLEADFWRSYWDPSTFCLSPCFLAMKWADLLHHPYLLEHRGPSRNRWKPPKLWAKIPSSFNTLTFQFFFSFIVTECSLTHRHDAQLWPPQDSPFFLIDSDIKVDPIFVPKFQVFLSRNGLVFISCA